MRWTLLQISEPMLAAPGAGLDPLARVAGVSIDSRTIRAGELFFAIHGPRHDGHDHVASALERGALAAVVAESRVRGFAESLRNHCLVVDDTLRALHRLATAVRLAWGKKIAGVTGSVGKTTTKEILAALLGAKLRVLKSEGNFNNAYGLPLTLFRLEDEHDAAVLEMGMSRRYELQELAAIAKPDVGVVTRVAPAHLEFFASVEEIALAKRELIEGLNGRDSVAVLNADDPLVAAFASHAPGRALTYGIDNAADYRAEAIEDRGALGSAFVLVENGKRTRLELALPGRHVISDALAALAAASVWGIGAAEAQIVFRSMHAPAMRGELLRFSDQGIGGDSGLSPPNSGRRRNARAWRDVGAASSRSRQVYGGNRENRLGRGRRRGCRANCGRRGGRRRTARADENVCVVRRGCEVSC